MRSDYLPGRRGWGLILSLSSLWFVFIVFFGSRHATLSPGWADEVSHLFTTWIFWDHGFKIFKEPTETFLATSPSTEHEAAEKAAIGESLGLSPLGFYRYPRPLEPNSSLTPREEQSRAVFIVVPNVPRPYPPGLYLLFTPISWLAFKGLLTPRQGVLAVTALGLIASHLAILILLQTLLRSTKPQTRYQLFLVYFTAAIAYSESIRWSLNSQYDILAILLIFAFLLAARREHWLESLLLYSTALFLHLRSLIFMPWAVWIFYRYLKANCWRLTARQILSLATGILLTGSAALTLLWNASYFQRPDLIDLNGMHWSKLGPGNWDRTLIFAASFALVCFLWSRARLWGTLACGIWCILLLVQSRLMREWYTLFLLPFFILAVCTTAEQNRQRALMATLFFYILTASLFMNNSPFEFRLFREIFAAVAEPR